MRTVNFPFTQLTVARQPVIFTRFPFKPADWNDVIIRHRNKLFIRTCTKVVRSGNNLQNSFTHVLIDLSSTLNVFQLSRCSTAEKPAQPMEKEAVRTEPIDFCGVIHNNTISYCDGGFWV